jgi:hypothetical protein
LMMTMMMAISNGKPLQNNKEKKEIQALID